MGIFQPAHVSLLEGKYPSSGSFSLNLIHFFHQALFGKISNLTNMFQMGWFNHPPVNDVLHLCLCL